MLIFYLLGPLTILITGKVQNMKSGLVLSLMLFSAVLAEADWYRQFARPKPADTKPVWQPEPTDDFSVQFGGNTRWQLNLDMLTRPNSSPLPREQMQAGATFRVTPRFSVGGEVSLGAERLNDSTQWEDNQVETGIRLKSAFKF